MYECTCTCTNNVLYSYVCMNVHVLMYKLYIILLIIMQIEQKTSNKNWMNCRHCKLPFCHQCNEPCFGRYHFNEFGCKEYTTLQEDMIKMKEDEKEDEEG